MEGVMNHLKQMVPFFLERIIPKGRRPRPQSGASPLAAARRNPLGVGLHLSAPSPDLRLDQVESPCRIGSGPPGIRYEGKRAGRKCSSG